MTVRKWWRLIQEEWREHQRESSNRRAMATGRGMVWLEPITNSKTVPCACGCERQVARRGMWDGYHGPEVWPENVKSAPKCPHHDHV